MNSIGGYFELELRKGKEYHPNAIALNTGRNAFELILKVKKYKKVFIPYYTCDAILEPINKLNLDYEFYNIDKTLRPIFDFNKILKEAVFVYNNYFGICDKQVTEIIKKCKNIIIDNSQAFYSKPTKNIDAFYSPRKFFGVPDGSYLYTDTYIKNKFDQDISNNKCLHLLGRVDKGAEEFYQNYLENENSLIGQPIKVMSNLTQQLLKSINYKDIARKRRENFIFLHKYLAGKNKLSFDLNPKEVPMVYPYWIEKGSELKNTLIKNKIYVATYWPNVIDWIKSENVFEKYLFDNLIPLPIDQRYNKKHMRIILSLINNNYE